MGLLTVATEATTKLVMWCNAHSSMLYSAVALGSGFGSVASAIVATQDVTRKIDAEEELLRQRGEPPLSGWEKFRIAFPSYIPCALLFGTSVAAILLNTIKEERRIATLAGLYSMSEKSFEEYRRKVEEMFGKKKEERVRDEIAADKVQQLVAHPQTIVITGNGNYPCLDAWSNTPFMSSQLAIESARVRIRDRVRDEMYISLEEVYEELELPLKRLDDGRTLVDYSMIGWTVDDQLDFHYTYCGGQNGEPTLVLTFMPAPHEGFNRLY